MNPEKHSLSGKTRAIEGSDPMTPTGDQSTRTGVQPRRLLRSVGALFLGFLAVVILSLGTDQVLHVLKVYPPWGQPMYDPSLNLLALAYRCVYGIIGGYLTARFAPHSPMRHAIVGGGIGCVLSLAGVIAAMRMELGPIWYPIGITLSSLPCAWLGGVLHRKWHT
jgi:hypothetical protein